MGSSSLSSESWLLREGWVEPCPPIPAVSLLLQSLEPAAWSSSEGQGALGRAKSSVDRPSGGAAGGMLFWELMEGFSLPLSAVCTPSGVGWLSEGGLDPGYVTEKLRYPTQISHTTYTTFVAMGMWLLTHSALRFVPWAPLWSGSHPPPQAYVLHCCPWHWTLDCSCTQMPTKISHLFLQRNAIRKNEILKINNIWLLASGLRKRKCPSIIWYTIIAFINILN